EFSRALYRAERRNPSPRPSPRKERGEGAAGSRPMPASLSPADIVAVVLVLAAVIGAGNYLWVRLQPAIAMVRGSLVVSFAIVASDRLLHLHVMRWFRGTLDAANLPHVFLDGALALLLFAASLHVDLAELSRRRFMIMLLATISVMLSTLVFGGGM